MVRCKKEGVNVPGVLGADWESGWVVLEYVEGRTVRRVLDGWAEGHSKMKEGGEGKEEGEGDKSINALMRRVGKEVGKIHDIGVCHGDLTTSNLMVKSSSSNSSSPQEDLDGDVYLIDFGLTTASIQDEDKAVDLYVLERAFAATHPAAEELFKEVLDAYGESYKGAKGVLKRLEGVRMRGRKRSMLG